jgi:hypothetical protein
MKTSRFSCCDPQRSSGRGQSLGLRCQATRLRCAWTRIALDVNSLPRPETIRSGLPRMAMTTSSSRPSRRPEIEVSATAARHF